MNEVHTIRIPTVKPLPLDYVALYHAGEDAQDCEHLTYRQVVELARYSAALSFKEALMLARIPEDIHPAGMEEARLLYRRYQILAKFAAVNNLFLEDPSLYLDWADSHG